MNSLVGYTGFVGSNIYSKGNFDRVYNSKNIQEAFGTNPELLIFAGIRAEKYLANNMPEKDLKTIIEAEKNIELINPKKLVLISTIDVFKKPINVDEQTQIDTENLHPYGYNRYQFELWARKKYPNALIIRLPALFGINLKKNFIYDYINIIPFMLNENKMNELCIKDKEIKAFYEKQNNGYYKLKEIKESEKQNLRERFKKLEFSALDFTDSRSKYQFYPLSRLWEDIQVAIKNNILLWHPATEPVLASELYRFLTNKEFVNEISRIPANYDYKTIYSSTFGGKDGYIMNKNEILIKIKEFVEREEKS